MDRSRKQFINAIRVGQFGVARNRNEFNAGFLAKRHPRRAFHGVMVGQGQHTAMGLP